MKLIIDLNELDIGNWIKVCPKDLQKRDYEIGEITHKWLEGHKPHFQLKIIRTSLPYVTEDLIKRMSARLNFDYNEKDEIKVFTKDLVYRLSNEEKSKIIKERILENLKCTR